MFQQCCVGWMIGQPGRLADIISSPSSGFELWFTISLRRSMACKKFPWQAEGVLYQMTYGRVAGLRRASPYAANREILGFVCAVNLWSECCNR
jgi:hypothetical protein